MDAKGLPADLKVGDPLLIDYQSDTMPPYPVTASHVGRTYVKVQRAGGGERRERFDRKTGIEIGGGSHPLILRAPTASEQ
ncbi:hypothetical protein ACFV3R_25450 [Streptomyces sp. NPDC059740]|uniref:beta barrel domain-containing protein n=1 Tax=Streptomyces sp. NPDC059740 TaxID=3346926 RepID=UPI003663BBD5